MKSIPFAKLSLEDTRTQRREAVKVHVCVLCVVCLVNAKIISYCEMLLQLLVPILSGPHIQLQNILFSLTQAKSSAQRFKVMSELRCLRYSDADNGTASAATPRTGGEERIQICDAMQEGGKEEQLVCTCRCSSQVLL